jgi:flavin reductase (DIM6/NTAB) family NADH-FMN oxidoreductase RutF
LVLISAPSKEENPVSFPPEDFRRACAQFATGITVVTTRDAQRQPQGFTANSFTSVSLDPPLVLVCIDKGGAMAPVFRETTRFGISVLNAGQKEISQRFARKGADRFGPGGWIDGVEGVPLIERALATFVCRPWQTIEAGDHWILIGEVLQVASDPGEPLLYFGSSYRELA